MSRPIAYNLVRLFLASMHTTPRGIDRIDFGYLSHIFEHWPAECVGVMPTILGMRYFSRERVMVGRDRLLRIWNENAGEGENLAWSRLRHQLCGGTAPHMPTGKRGMLPDLAGLSRMTAILLDGGINLGLPMSTLPRHAIYLDMGHFGITAPGAFGWRRHRPDIDAVFMIHDAIPLEYPEMVARDTVKAHRKLMAIAGKQAQAIITPTAAAGTSIRVELARHGRGDLPIFPVSLPIDAVFSRDVVADADIASEPYFVVCGVIEPRKNHALLFDVWEELIRHLGDKTPRLIIAGSPGYASADIIARIPRGAGRAPIVQISGLSSPALARLMAGARAVLMPSLAEGFGLPPIEAMAVGTPAILSDIGAHREAAGQYGLFLAAHDRAGWLTAVMRLATDETVFAAEKARIKTFRPTSWSDYIDKIGAVLHTLPDSSPSV